MSQPESPAPTPEAIEIAALPTEVIINGGQSIKARLNNGTTEEVKVKLVPIGKVASYLEKIGDPGAFVDFICGKPKDWSDTVEPDSFMEIDELARKINDPIVARFLKRQQRMMQGIGPMSKGLTAFMNSSATR